MFYDRINNLQDTFRGTPSPSSYPNLRSLGRRVGSRRWTTETLCFSGQKRHLEWKEYTVYPSSAWRNISPNITKIHRIRLRVMSLHKSNYFLSETLSCSRYRVIDTLELFQGIGRTWGQDSIHCILVSLWVDTPNKTFDFWVHYVHFETFHHPWSTNITVNKSPNQTSVRPEPNLGLRRSVGKLEVKEGSFYLLL